MQQSRLKQQVFWAIGKQPNLRLIDETWLKYEGDLISSIAALIAGEITALRLISFLMKSPNIDRPEPFDLDWDEIAQGWCPPVALSLNRPIFPSALHRIGDEVFVDFYDGKWALDQAECS